MRVTIFHGFEPHGSRSLAPETFDEVPETSHITRSVEIFGFRQRQMMRVFARTL